MSKQGITVIATSDVHAPRYLQLLYKAIREIHVDKVDLVILAGDLIERGKAGYFKYVVDAFSKYFSCPIFAVFGNEEYDEVKDKLRGVRGVRWLDDEICYLRIDKYRVALVGTRGSLDEPTSWQSRHIPRIREIYSERVRLIERLLIEARCSADIQLLITHYAPFCDTLKGEKKSIWRQLSSRAMTAAIEKGRPTAVIHGHLHNSTVHKAYIGTVPVYNVSLPALRKVAIINLQPEHEKGLLAFLGGQ